MKKISFNIEVIKGMTKDEFVEQHKGNSEKWIENAWNQAQMLIQQADPKKNKEENAPVQSNTKVRKAGTES